MELFETLASLPGMGHVRRCPHGCLHLTYGAVSLHFPDVARFVSFSRYLSRLTPDAQGNALVRYEWIALSLHCCALRELQGMAFEALQHIENGRSTELRKPLHFVT